MDNGPDAMSRRRHFASGATPSERVRSTPCRDATLARPPGITTIRSSHPGLRVVEKHMQTIEFTLPAAEVRELMPFEVSELWPEVQSPECQDAETMPWNAAAPCAAEACTEVGFDVEEPVMSTTERRLNWLVRAGIGIAMVSLAMVVLPG
jgi:hypothetical protein